MTTHDEDHTDPRQFCVHGQFIGSWWGPDYLCGYCEEGISAEEYQAIQTAKAPRSLLQAIDRIAPAFIRNFHEGAFPDSLKHRIACVYVDIVMTNYDELNRLVRKLEDINPALVPA